MKGENTKRHNTGLFADEGMEAHIRTHTHTHTHSQMQSHSHTHTNVESDTHTPARR